MEKMKIQVWSDIACPYCYIGKRKLEKALEQFDQKDNIEIVWRSYELNPSLPKMAYGKSYTEYLCEFLGLTPEQVKQNNEKITTAAKEVGLEYNLDKLVVANTCEALRLIKLADRYNMAGEMEELLFKAYFTDGENVSDKDTLIRLGGMVGIPSEEVEKLISGTDFFDDVIADVQLAEGKLGLEYIPFYLLNNKYSIQGSVEISDYLDILKKAYEDFSKKGTVDTPDEKEIISGQSCSMDKVCD